MSKGKLVAVCCVWLAIVGVGAMAWNFWIAPAKEAERSAAAAAKQAAEEAARRSAAEEAARRTAAEEAAKRKAAKDLADRTGTASNIENHIRFALDEFSGYAVLRSEEFKNELEARKIGIKLLHDDAKYPERLLKLQNDEVDLAAFTIDALIKVSAEIRDIVDIPTIVAIIDETRGADAIVGYKSVVPNVDALNRADMKFVLTPDSPSETLARVVMANFHLDNLVPNPFVKASDAADVFQRYKNAKPDDHQVYVLWEPYVSKILENPNTHVVVDSSKFRGKIVDVIVANRDYLDKNKSVVKEVVQCYFRAYYQHRNNMVQLVLDDAAGLTNEQAGKIVQGIWWKNTIENYAHMGLSDSNPLQHIESIVRNITTVLKSTGAISRDPTNGRPNVIYYDKILRDMKDGSIPFNPGDETLRDDKLPALTENEWKRLIKVGEDRDSLEFAAGLTTLTEASRVKLDDIVERLKTTRYYIIIRGNASTRGDPKANEELASNRAKAAETYLIEKGINRNRVRAIGVQPSGTPSVSFVLGQPPY